MKKTSKFLLAAAMAMSTVSTPLAVMMTNTPVLAANVTISDSTNDGDLLKDHTFTAYQIFSGIVVEGSLTNVAWGSGIDSTNFLKALKDDKTIGSKFEDCLTAPDVAQVLENEGNNSETATKFARIAEDNVAGDGTVLPENGANLAQGYYVIVDKTDGNPAVYNPALLEVVGGEGDNVVIELKNDVPTVEKKVKEDDHTVTNDTPYGEKYNDVADYNIGEIIPFSFYSKVPTNIAQYDVYEYTFTDKMSKGLTLAQDSITVAVGTTTLVKGTDFTVSDITTNSTTGEQTFSVTITNLRAITAATAGASIRVDFNASLNSNAAIGLPGNPNTVNLTYSNNPNDSTKKHTTPDDAVIVFTYELDITKEDNVNSDIKLNDAEFQLWDNIDATNHKVAVVKDGKFVKWVNATEVDNVRTEEGTVILKTTGENDEKGKFSIVGLDAGTYYLKETKAPDGYVQPANPFVVTITSTTKNDNGWNGTDANEVLTALTVTVDSGSAVTGNVNSGSVAATIKNSNTSQLPETGGMGTTMIYGVGGVMVVGAAVIYITNKRTRKE